MGLRIQNNVEAFNAHRQLSGTASRAAKSMEKLSSGYRINRAADDAAGLVGNLIGWACALAIWRQIVVQEVRSVAEARREQARARAEAMAAAAEAA